MGSFAERMCYFADMDSNQGRHILGLNADDFVTFLEVARTGRYSSAADKLQINHTTVSRRIARLEGFLGGRVLTRGAVGSWEVSALGEQILDAATRIDSAVKSVIEKNFEGALQGSIKVSAPDGFASYILAPAAAQVRKEHPRVSIEIVTATRRAFQQRSDIDLQIVVGEPQVNRAMTQELCTYMYGLYASKHYLEVHQEPHDMKTLSSHSLIYFADAMVNVDALDMLHNFEIERQPTISATNTFVHVEATRAGAGIGLLANYMAKRHPELVRVMKDTVNIPLTYWMVARRDTLQRPEVTALARSLARQVDDMRLDLLG